MGQIIAVVALGQEYHVDVWIGAEELLFRTVRCVFSHTPDLSWPASMRARVSFTAGVSTISRNIVLR